MITWTPRGASFSLTALTLGLALGLAPFSTSPALAGHPTGHGGGHPGGGFRPGPAHATPHHAARPAAPRFHGNRGFVPSRGPIYAARAPIQARPAYRPAFRTEPIVGAPPWGGYGVQNANRYINNSVRYNSGYRGYGYPGYGFGGVGIGYNGYGYVNNGYGYGGYGSSGYNNDSPTYSYAPTYVNPAAGGIGLAGVAADPGAVLGMSEQATVDGDGPGLLVTGVAPQSPADRAGLWPGDVIHAGNGLATRTPGDLQSILSGSPNGVLNLTIRSAIDGQLAGRTAVLQ